MLVISLLLFLFFSTSAVSYMLTKRIEDSVNQLAYVDDVSLQAVTTMDAGDVPISVEIRGAGIAG